MISDTAGGLAALEEIRAQFQGLAPDHAHLDGAAGTLVPESVVGAIAEATRFGMANVHGAFAASQVSTAIVDDARRALADLVGGVPEGVVLGPNMTTLTFHLADALSRTWNTGDEIVVTSLDHDANVRPWCLAAERTGAAVRVAEFDPETGELPVESVQQVLSARTRLVAVTAASNAIGTRPDVAAITGLAHAEGALTYVDGVHATPHGPTDVAALGADFYACSSYKFFGPHTGAVIADPDLLAGLHPAKLVPSPEESPERFERGTPAFELLAAVTAAIDWLAGLTDTPGSRRQKLVATFNALENTLRPLHRRLLDGLSQINGARALGAARHRTPTVSFVLAGHPPDAVSERLAERGVDVWSGDNYAYELMRRFGLAESGGAVRASIVLYNTPEDIDRLLSAVSELAES
ncbi:MAG TPA: cysteine desulfurase-like protein [Solirubrobacteraceae bacterium]|nr:cysteine desulfurase-like protein [Solirubrobacteraceae bacterium]